jgi:lipopolysaccharide/colanic/teichoic acid biosynthesis glycosyltransferase
LSSAVFAAGATGDPSDVHLAVTRISNGMDWAALLPPRAAGLSWRLQQGLKRLLDVTLAVAALVVLSPLLLVVAFLVWRTSPGPVLYRWRVLGRHARPFVGYKFRTMVQDADALKRRYMDRNEMTGPVFKLRNDPRITPLGRWLRKYSIDELPQLWSVITGDMSLVGPRPPSAEEFVQFEPWQRGKLAVTPGITCLWQVSGRSEISDFSTWARLDLQYIRDWNLWVDLVLLAKTLPAVLTARGAY